MLEPNHPAYVSPEVAERQILDRGRATEQARRIINGLSVEMAHAGGSLPPATVLLLADAITEGIYQAVQAVRMEGSL